MDNDLVRALRAEREELQRRIERSQQRIKRIDALLEEYTSEDDAIDAILFRKDEIESAKAAEVSAPLSPSAVGRVAREILIEQQKPLTRGELLAAMTERGYRIRGIDRAKVIGTTLWRLRRPDNKPAFRNTRWGYWPSDLNLPSPFGPGDLISSLDDQSED